MKRNHTLCSRLLFAAMLGGSIARAGAQHVITHDGVEVTVHPAGVLASLPQAGLRTCDGPRVELGDDFAEWFGLMFECSGESHSGVGEGVERDWAQREPVELLAFDSWRDRSRSVARFHDARITTSFAFDPDGPYLIVDVEIANLGTRTLRNVVYTREWRSPGKGGWSFPEVPAQLTPLKPDIARRVWMLGDLPPGRRSGVTLSFQSQGPAGAPLLPPEVPLFQWTSPQYPAGLVFGAVYGISWGDYDGDGWPDVFCTPSKKLWRNVGGSDWILAATLDPLLPNTPYRYGCAFGDWDANGVQDIATAPRNTLSDNWMHLLHNDGAEQFHDIVHNQQLVDVPPRGDAETLCWGDVDGDKRLDLFVPVYPPWAFGGLGNFFLHNAGPVASGETAFHELSAVAGLDNPPGSSRPEGAQLADIDDDGDLDLFSNGTIYRNRSIPGLPRFDALNPAASGVLIQTVLEEGAQFFDYDLDGDLDLATVYSQFPGVRIWESRGDGTFFTLEDGGILSPLIGLDLGLSAEDWDNDGDIDFSTRQVFRRNQLIETGARRFTVAQHGIPAGHITSATPAWADWDRDGDLDCALGNWSELGRLYANSTYDASTPLADRRYIRVRPVCESTTVPRGLDVEYGASVEIRMRNAVDPWRRRKFTSSSAGYLNQNEYALHFALPADPTPLDPKTDLELELKVDFPITGMSAPWRVDHHVNPRLGDVELSALASREIKVFRVGEVVIDGVSTGPSTTVSPQLVASAGGLVHCGLLAPIPALTPAPDPNTWVALEVRTPSGGDAVLVDELVIDGQLAAPFACRSGSFNLALWDFTNPANPVRVATHTAATDLRNSRTGIPWEFALAPGRVYRIAAHMASYRPTNVQLPVDHGNLEARAAAFYSDLEPCNATAISAAAMSNTRVYFALLFHR